jgi:hypothetical protein
MKDLDKTDFKDNKKKTIEDEDLLNRLV